MLVVRAEELDVLTGRPPRAEFGSQVELFLMVDLVLPEVAAVVVLGARVGAAGPADWWRDGTGLVRIGTPAPLASHERGRFTAALTARLALGDGVATACANALAFTRGSGD